MPSSSFPKDFWKSLIGLLVLYTLLQLIYFIPESSFPEAVRRIRLSPLWFLLAVVYAAGWLVIRQWEVSWLLMIWHVVHISLAGYALATLAYMRFIGPVPNGIATSIRPIVEFLISPVLYLALGLLYRTTRR